MASPVLVYLGIPALIACMCGIEFVLIVRSSLQSEKEIKYKNI